MLHKSKIPYVRDLYLAYLIDGAERTKTDEFPIIEKWMVVTEPPLQIIQWDRRRDVVDAKTTCISFYCCDIEFRPILNNPKAYVEKLKQYQCVVGMDASPYDNMPLVVQKSQIYLNLAISYYFGKCGIKIIPNIRIGDDRTLSSLEAYPHNTLISIGTNGFTHNKKNKIIFKTQVKQIIDTMEPSGICVYGPTPDEIFQYPKEKGIPIYQYDSFSMKENRKTSLKGGKNER